LNNHPDDEIEDDTFDKIKDFPFKPHGKWWIYINRSKTQVSPKVK